MKIGKALKEAREEAQKSVYDVERDIKISHVQIYKWEKDIVIPSIEKCIILADYYGISIDELVGHEIKKNWL